MSKIYGNAFPIEASIDCVMNDAKRCLSYNGMEFNKDNIQVFTDKDMICWLYSDDLALIDARVKKEGLTLLKVLR